MRWPIAFIAACWFFEENSFFGWNGTPQSSAELICDGVFCLIFVLSLV